METERLIVVCWCERKTKLSDVFVSVSVELWTILFLKWPIPVEFAHVVSKPVDDTECA